MLKAMDWRVREVIQGIPIRFGCRADAVGGNEDPNTIRCSRHVAIAVLCAEQAVGRRSTDLLPSTWCCTYRVPCLTFAVGRAQPAEIAGEVAAIDEVREHGPLEL